MQVKPRKGMCTVETITYSEIRKFIECPLSHHYAYVKLLRPALVSPAINKGRMFHAGMAEWLRERNVEKALAVTKADYDKYITDAEAEGIILTDERLEQLELDYEIVTVMVKGAVERFANEFPEITHIETPFSFTLTDDVMFAGKVDFIGVDKYGKPFIGEWKTTSDSIETFKRKLALDWQTIVYAWGWEKATGIKINNAYFYMVQTTSSKPHAKEDTQQYYDRLHTFGITWETKNVPKAISEQYPRLPESQEQYHNRLINLYSDNGMYGSQWVPIDRQLVDLHNENIGNLVANIVSKNYRCPSYGLFTCEKCHYKSLCMNTNDVEFVRKDRKHMELDEEKE